MNFKFNNMGPVKQGSIELGNITILCGKNNTGKTYVSYTIYGFFRNLQYILDDIISDMLKSSKTDEGIVLDLNKLYDDLDKIRKKVNKSFNAKLGTIYNTDSNNMLSDTKIEIEDSKITRELFLRHYNNKINAFKQLFLNKCLVDNSDKNYLIFKSLDKDSFLAIRYIEIAITVLTANLLYKIDQTNVFMLPAERCGLNLFYKELNVNRNNAIYNINLSDKDYSIKNNFSKYPLPISDYINFLNDLQPYKKNDNGFNELSTTLENSIIEGNFVVTEDSSIEFVNKDNKEIDFHLSSSTAKSLFGLDYYLNNNVRKGNLLIIDEPEQNLHPDNQRKLARLLANLSNKNVKVLISTHSDYIIKEFNNLIQLGTKFKGYQDIMQQHGYSEAELLSSKNVKSYILANNIIDKIEINENGMEIETFDEVINSMNYVSDEIFYSFYEEEDSEQ